MTDIIINAVREFGGEVETLRFLPELRYDRTVFPTQGQYDWLAGQVLYCLVRAVRPRTAIEFSTSSGYSTTFTALALRANGSGKLHSVDLDRDALESAGRWLASRGLDSVVELHHGDCRKVVPRLLSPDVDLLFVDTLHSFDITEWYLGSVVPRLRPDALVHIHDVMPPEARVRIHGAPPFAPTARVTPQPWVHLVKRFFWLLLRGSFPNPFPAQPPREILPLDRLEVHPPATPGELPTIDGNYFEEAVVIRELLRGSDPAEGIYLHRLIDSLPELEPHRYASDDRIGRSNARGEALEWNDALWCHASLLQREAPPERVRGLIRRLRREYG